MEGATNEARGNRGGRRGRGRGVSTSQLYNKDQPIDEAEVDFAVAGPSQPTPPSIVDVSSAAAGPAGPMTTMADNGKGIVARLPAEKRARLEELGARKEVGLFLMTDAPPSKNRRNVSPVRLPCPLVPGTPEVLSPSIPQKCELLKSALDASGPSRVELERAATPPQPCELGDGAATLPPLKEHHQLALTPSTGVIALSEGQEVDENLMDEASVDLIDYSPSRSPSAERSILQNFSPGPLTTSTSPEPLISEEDLEEENLQMERSADLNPGSDVEDEDCLDLGLRRRHAGEFAVEDLSSELCEVLRSMDRQDDWALRELSQEDMLQFDWSHDPDVFTGVRESFSGPAGPTFPIVGMSPFEIFSKIWDIDIINLIVDETNKYAASLVCATTPRYSRLRKWTPITPKDLWTFFGVIMLQSIVPNPVEEEYWTSCSPYLKVGRFSDIMPHHRFLLIKRCLHFVDNKSCASGISSKLVKIQPIIDHLNGKFSSLYLPEQEIALDESLMLWNGQTSYSQLITSKAAKTGIKSYELCEPKTGYLWQMIIRTGKKEQQNLEDNEATNKAEPEDVTSKIVLQLVRPLLNRGHTLAMDHFYNSPLLTRTLKAQKTDVMGTLRLTREFVPGTLRYKNKTNMQAGEVAFSQTRDMTVLVWNDSNVVALISTYHKVEGRGKEKYGVPKVVSDYNLAMGRVDKKDQALQAFPIESVRNAVWYKKLFRRLFNVSIHNTFVMFAEAGPAKMAQRQFRVKLASEIIQRFRPLEIEEPPFIGHFPAQTGSRTTRCRWCAWKKKVACTTFKCSTCNVNLCIIGCFKKYHLAKGLVL